MVMPLNARKYFPFFKFLNLYSIHIMAESEEELKSLLTKVKEESEKAGLKVSIQKMKIMASSPVTSWQMDGETAETARDYILGLQNHCEW